MITEFYYFNASDYNKEGEDETGFLFVEQIILFEKEYVQKYPHI